jgi:hypothetical protein
MLRQKVAKNVSISLGYFIFSGEAQLTKKSLNLVTLALDQILQQCVVNC